MGEKCAPNPLRKRRENASSKSVQTARPPGGARGQVVLEHVAAEDRRVNDSSLRLTLKTLDAASLRQENSEAATTIHAVSSSQ